MLMMCGFYIMVRTEKPAPLLQHRSRKQFSSALMRPTGRSSSMHFMEMLPKGGLRQRCRRCRLSQAHPVLLLNDSVFILRDTGGLNDHRIKNLTPSVIRGMI